jgi:HAD superfamily hydrolase (TIGR01549 family)
MAFHTMNPGWGGRTLTGLGVAWAIATSGRPAAAQAMLRLLEIPDGVPVVTRADVSRAKPDPDLLLLGARRLGASIEDCIVVGDSVRDMLAARRARSLGFNA